MTSIYSIVTPPIIKAIFQYFQSNEQFDSRCYWLCCVIQFRDRAAPFHVLFSQYNKFQAYLTQ
ncbi:hypothetical protein FCV76_07120 [Vibrio sp. F13]|nr:hypothetical protein FCV76_07120 [Vibrio sp. F13]